MTDKSYPKWWRPVFEYGPLLAFFTVLVISGRLGLTERALLWFALAPEQESTARFLLATLVFVPLGLVGTTVLWFTAPEKPYILLIGTLMLLVFGGLTLYFRDPLFLQIRVTLANLLFATGLSIGMLLGRWFLKDLMAANLPFAVNDSGWRAVTWMWIVFFILLATLNEWLRRVLGTDAWAWVTKAGFPVATFIVSIAMLAILNRHKMDNQSSA